MQRPEWSTDNGKRRRHGQKQYFQKLFNPNRQMTHPDARLKTDKDKHMQITYVDSSTIEDVYEAINKLKNNKAPEVNTVTGELKIWREGAGNQATRTDTQNMEGRAIISGMANDRYMPNIQKKRRQTIVQELQGNLITQYSV